MPLCQHCGDVVLEADITVVWTEYASDTFPGTFEEWCKPCARSDERDDMYDEAARKRWARIDREAQ